MLRSHLLLKPLWRCVVPGIPMLEYLASRFGKDSVVDVLPGTVLGQYSKDSYKVSVGWLLLA